MEGTSIRDDERAEFWLTFSHDDLARRTAALHAQRREAEGRIVAERVEGGRYAVASQFLRGKGIEVGAGSRPFPLPSGATALLGDIRDAEALQAYFSTSGKTDAFIDAQTFEGVADASQDFVVSAHVIEHLMDPIGSIQNALRVIGPGGHLVLAVPDKRFTFDKLRPVTSLQHLQADRMDGGVGTRHAAYVEFLEYVEPYFGRVKSSLEELDERARKASDDNTDIHFHTWTFETFSEMLASACSEMEFTVVCAIEALVNENIFVLRKGF